MGLEEGLEGPVLLVASIMMVMSNTG